VTVGLYVFASVASAAGVPYREVALGAAKVKLPTVGFVLACDENAQLAARVKAMTPPTSGFVTCMVRPDKWKAAKSGAPVDLTPIIVVTVQKQQPGEAFSVQEFKTMRDKAYSLQSAMVAGGSRSFKGFFATPDRSLSFSFLVGDATPTPSHAASTATGKMQSVSTVYFAGHLLNVVVVDRADGNEDGHRTRDVTIDWLRAFQASNAPVAN